MIRNKIGGHSCQDHMKKQDKFGMDNRLHNLDFSRNKKGICVLISDNFNSHTGHCGDVEGQCDLCKVSLAECHHHLIVLG